MKKSYFYLLLLVNLLFLSFKLFAQEWHSIGPPQNPVSMCVTSNYFLLGTVYGGIARSTDAGISWRFSTNKNLLNTMITDIQHDPVEPQLVYVTTGPNDMGAGHGFFKSTDGGITWNEKNSGLPPFYIALSASRNISINPFSRNEIYIYVEDYPYESGIYKSTDYGETWNFFYNTLNGSINTSLIINPVDSTLKYAVESDLSLHKWKNGIDSVFPSTTINLSHGKPVAVFINPKTGSLFYITRAELYKWTENDTCISLTSNLKLKDLNFDYIINARINQLSGYIFLSTNSGFFKSTDDGVTWIQISDFKYMNLDIYLNEITVAGYSGIYSSIDDGLEWSRIAYGPNNSIVYSTSIYFSPNRNTIYTTVVDIYKPKKHLFKSTDDGENWFELNLPNNASPTIVKVNPLNPDIVYVGCGDFYTTNFGLYKSLNGGNNWKQVLPDSTLPVTAVYIPENDTGRILLGCPGTVWQSTNSGSTWEVLLSFTGSSSLNETSVVKISQTHPATIAVGTIANDQSICGFFITTDSGYYWERRINGLAEGLPYTAITAIAIHPINDNIIFLGNSASLYKTTNQGKTWNMCGFPDILNSGVVNDIQFAPDNPKVVFVAVRGVGTGEGGFYISDDDGETWNEINFPNTSYKSSTFINISYFNNNYRIYVGTLSFGLFMGEIPRITSVNRNKSTPIFTTLSQNYPNPFNPATVIKYHVGINSFITIKVYDLLGRVVKTLVNENQNAGNHFVTFNGIGLSNGVYFYRMQAVPADGQTGIFVSTKKFILLK